MKMKALLAAALCLFTAAGFAQEYPFDGLNMSLGNLSRLSDAKTRSISPENFTGEKGKGGMATPQLPATRNVNNASWAARDLGQTWKVNPFITIESKETVTIAEIEGPGAIQHIWMTPTGVWRWSIIRIYWDDEKEPSVECPIADFFCMGWNEYAPVVSLPVCVNPGSAFNCYWQMPFRKKCKITIENVNDSQSMNLYYQIDYTLTDVPKDAGYFHAQFRRTRYNETSDFTIIDGVKGKGQYVGVYMAWGLRNNGWWGEGEIKFYMDKDTEYPTICGTGTEDYFCGSYDFEDPFTHDRYVPFTTPYAGLHHVITPDTLYRSQFRFGMYRWHITDPIRFEESLRVTIQALGWRSGGRYLPLQDDLASVSYWYQTLPTAPFPTLPGRDELEVI